MDNLLVSLFDHIGLGTFLAYVVAFGVFIIAILKVIKSYNKIVIDNADKQKENADLVDSVGDLTKSISELKTQIEEDREYQKSYQDSMNERFESMDKKFESLHAAIESNRKSSDTNDAKLQVQIEKIEEHLDIIDKKNNLLIESDKEGIKATIIDKYYKALDDGWVPIHVMQSMELLYEKYLQENGNTFVAGLMDAMRQLPNKPPVKRKSSTSRKKTTEVNRDAE